MRELSRATLAPDARVEVDAGDQPEGPPGARLGEPERPSRSVRYADVVGVLVVVAAMLAVNQLGVDRAGTALGTSRGIRVASVAVGMAAGLGVLFLIVRERGRLVRVTRLVTGVWRDPPTDWVAFALGAALALPVLGFYWPRLGQHSDSGRLLSSVDHVWRGDLGYLADNQEPYLPYLLHGPTLAVGGLPAARLLTILTVVVLAGITALITYRITASLWGGGAAAVALLSIVGAVELALFSPMYPLMLSLGYLGGWYAYRAVTDAGGGWRYSIVAGVCVALAPEAHAVGQLFLAAPALTAVLAPTRRLALRMTARTYAVTALALVPRLVINLSEGGLDWITNYRTDFWVTRGYVLYIQENLWGYEGINEPIGHYLSLLPGRYYDALGSWGWVVVAGAGLGWLCCRRRQRLFVLAVAGFMLLAITVKQIPSFPRYYSPMYPGMAILSGVVVATFVRHRRSRAARWVLRLGGAACTVALVLGAVGTVDRVRAIGEHYRLSTDESLPVQRMVASVDDDRGIIGARAHQMFFGISNANPTWGDQYLTEDEYTTYLTWPSDDEVVALLEEHGIGWVVVHGNLLLETRYNDTWLQPYHGLSTRHVEAIAVSPRFCPWFQEGGYRLYKLGACPAGAGVPDQGASG